MKKIGTIIALFVFIACSGDPGEMGPQGEQGVAGPKGDVGPAGPQGATGPAGAKGDKGDVGPAGVKGDKGDPGVAGVAGATGPAGPAGAVGATGATGPKGDKGDKGDPGLTTDPSKIVASIFCSGAIENTNLDFTYNVVQFANRNVFASGTIRGPVDQTSDATIYAPSQNGYDDASVIIRMDAYAPADAGWWSLSLNRSTLVTTLVYHDDDMPEKTKTWTMQPSKCVNNTY